MAETRAACATDDMLKGYPVATRWGAFIFHWDEVGVDQATSGGTSLLLLLGYGVIVRIVIISVQTCCSRPEESHDNPS